MKTKRERFETIAAKRVQKIINDLESLSKCSNKNNYEYNVNDIQKMMSVIKKKTRNVEELFFSKLSRDKQSFEF
jgi:hypothetical protein